MTTSSFQETHLNLIAEGTRLEGKIIFDHLSRVYGVLVGEVHSTQNSTLILGETAVVEGNIFADSLIIDGYVRGNIVAKKRTIISKTGRVLGNIHTPSIQLEFGAYLEGNCQMIDDTYLETTQDKNQEPHA